MNEETKFSFTRAQLSAALATWEADAKRESWADRDDADRHDVTADYLIKLMQES